VLYHVSYRNVIGGVARIAGQSADDADLGFHGNLPHGGAQGGGALAQCPYGFAVHFENGGIDGGQLVFKIAGARGNDGRKFGAEQNHVFVLVEVYPPNASAARGKHNRRQNYRG
jgi:hypothetical protein